MDTFIDIARTPDNVVFAINRQALGFMLLAAGFIVLTASLFSLLPRRQS